MELGIHCITLQETNRKLNMPELNCPSYTERQVRTNEGCEDCNTTKIFIINTPAIVL